MANCGLASSKKAITKRCKQNTVAALLENRNFHKFGPFYFEKLNSSKNYFSKLEKIS